MAIWRVVTLALVASLCLGAQDHQPNLNGDYILSATPGTNPKDFPTLYTNYPRGVEYFDVYSPNITSLYSQVFWKGLDPVTDIIPKHRELRLRLRSSLGLPG